MLRDDGRATLDELDRPPVRVPDEADTRLVALRRLLRTPRLGAEADDLPPELAFLLAQGVDAALVRRASRVAEEGGTSGEAALFGLGFPDDRYYRLLARHLGAAYLDRPLPLARVGVDRIAGSVSGAAALAPNPGNLHHVFAPRGEALRLLIADHRFADVGHYDFAITTPRRLDALLRRHDAAGLCESSASGLSGWDAALSARGGPTGWQVSAMLIGAVLLVAGFLVVPAATRVVLSVVLLVAFTGAVTQRLIVILASRPPGGDEAARSDDRDLPIYTLIVPLLREAGVLAQLVHHLDALDYPPAKLDIKLMLESHDRDTMAAAASLSLPARYDVIVLPDGHPRTKPRALNAGLDTARGDFVVVYDAEDRPDPGQLRAAVARFAAAPSSVACLQGRLTIDHADETWITRMFTLDYAALFHVVKPGLAALGLPIPLGGTSNHFRAAALRRVGGWDAWNVTEDIDLGYRLGRFGYAVESLDSDTFEEAPLTLARWMPQRSRWLKGWMVTLLVHAREPRRLIRDFGWRAGLSIAVSLVGTVLSCLFGPPFLVLVLAEGRSGVLFRPETPLWWLTVAGAAALLVAGVAAAVGSVIVGLARMGRLDLAVWVLTLPVYLLLVSVAAWRGLLELWWDPQGWNKTEHGLSRRRASGGPRRFRT